MGDGNGVCYWLLFQFGGKIVEANSKAFLSGQISATYNGISIYYAAKEAARRLVNIYGG